MANFDEDKPTKVADGVKEQVMSSFLLHAPPGEFKEVFTAVRTLINDDALLKSEGARVIAEYNKEQFTPCKLEGSEFPVLITEHGNLGSGRFLDPRTNKSFKYDHLKKVASDVSDDAEIAAGDEWRRALEAVMTTYTEEQFKKLGSCSTYVQCEGAKTTLIVCIESHQYKPTNYWNGKWRSQWSVVLNASDGTAEVVGVMKVQVHYYEDGNVQLITSKEHHASISVTNEKETAKAFCSVVSQVENDYQVAISENYQNMSNTTFKALRRTLPVTRNKIDWNKIISYRIGSELKHNPE